MDALFEFFTNNPLAFWISFWIIVAIVILLLGVTLFAYKQGRKITIWKILTIGPMTPLESIEENIPRKFSEQFECNCELTDMLYLTLDKTWEPVPAANIWSYKISNCILFLDHPTEKAHLKFDVEIKDNDQYISQFKYTASGTFDGSIAYLEYRLAEINRKNRSWRGVVIIRIPKSGRIYGFWMTTGILSHNRVGLGSIQLTRR